MVIAALAPVIAFLDSLGFIGQMTHIVKLPALDAALTPTAASLGMELTIFKYTVGLFLVYPFSYVLYKLPNANMKHMFSFAVGFFLVQWIYGPDWIHSFVSSLGIYLIAMLFPRRPKLAFAWAMGYMTMSHIYRMYVSYLTGEFDHTGTQMVLTMKLTSFAYNISDGIDHAVMVPEPGPVTDKSKARVLASRRHFAIPKLPNLLQFLGYVYCFTCILAGPAFEYKDYLDSIEGTSFLTTTSTSTSSVEGDDKLKEQGGDKVVKKPANVLPALQRLLIGVFCMVAYLQFSAHIPVRNLVDPEFNKRFNWLPRLGIMLLTMFGERFKYYFVWKTAEGASIMGGFGFEGYKDGKAGGWSGVENIDILSFETATSSSIASRAWNKRTQGWLERYTYLRTGKSLYATYFVSSLWHGLYPGFFFVFFTIALITEVERVVKLKLNPILLPGYTGKPGEPYPDTLIAKLYNIAAWLGFSLALNYTAQPFSLGSLERSLEAFRAAGYYGHVALISLYVVFSLLPGGKREKKEGKESKDGKESKKE
jgi:hypothetical protein